MPSVDSYDASVTSIEFPWPREITPVERVMLSASGDLQRLLSAFFARPVTVIPIFVQTSPPHKPSPLSSGLRVDEDLKASPSAAALMPSPSRPTMQRRQVHLVCNASNDQGTQPRTVCVATSKVTITDPRCARLFLKEKYAIGQIFRKMGVVPSFVLQDVGIMQEECEDQEVEIQDEKNGLGLDFGDTKSVALDRKESSIDGSSHNARKERIGHPQAGKLWRRYTLETAGFSAEIVEVFPDRLMFVLGEVWLDNSLDAPPVLPPSGLLQHRQSRQHLRVPLENYLDCASTLSLSPTDTLVQNSPSHLHISRPASRAGRADTQDSGVMPPVVKSAETWAETNGLLRFMAVFIAVLLLLNVPRDGGSSSGASGEVVAGSTSLSWLLTRATRLLDVRGHADD